LEAAASKYDKQFIIDLQVCLKLFILCIYLRIIQYVVIRKCLKRKSLYCTQYTTFKGTDKVNDNSPSETALWQCTRWQL
jgi:hypothetical protein